MLPTQVNCRQQRLQKFELSVRLGLGILSGVEKRHSDVSLPVAIGQIFIWPPQSGLTWFCFLFPLIELDRRVSRIQLSEKGSRCCPRKAGGSLSKPSQPKRIVQELVGVPFAT